MRAASRPSEADSKGVGMKGIILVLLFGAFGVGFAVARQHEVTLPIDAAVNAMLAAAGAPNHQATRVVPIENSGGLVSGYAQIVGTRSSVAATRAVVRISAPPASGWTVDAYIPVTGIDRHSGTIHRQYGVAIDALVKGRPQ